MKPRAMFSRFILALIILVVACEQKPEPVTPQVIAQNTATVPLPPTATFSPTLSSTPTTTLRPTATNTAIPTHTPTPSPTIPVAGVGTPVHRSQAVIVPENVTQLAELARWGRGVINDVAYSADGNWIAVGTSRGIYVHDVHDFQAEPQHIEITGGADKVAISPDGGLVAAALPNQQVQMWRIADQTLLYSLSTLAYYSLQFSFDGRFLATNQDVRWANSGELYFAAPDEQAFATTFSPSGETVAVWSYGLLSLYHISDLTLLAEYEPNLLNRDEDIQGGLFGPVQFLNDEEFLTLIPAITPNGLTGYNEVQKGNTGELLFAIDPIEGKAQSFPTFCDQPIYFADPPGSPATWHMEISVTEQRVAFLYNDSSYENDPVEYDSIRVHWLGDGQLLYTVEEGMTAMDFAPDGQSWVTATQGGELQIRQVRDGTILENYAGYSAPVMGITFSPDPNIVAVAYLDKVVLHRLSDGAVLFTYPATQVAFAPNQEHFALGYADGRIELRHHQDGTLTNSWITHADAVTSLVFAATGDVLISSGLDCVVNRWQVPDGSLIGPLETLQSDQNITHEPLSLIVRDLLLFPDQDWLMGRVGSGVVIWQIQDGTLITVSESIPFLNNVVISPNGRYLATSGTATLLWHITEAGEWNALMDGGQTRGDVAFSPDSQMLITGREGLFRDSSLSGALEIWSVLSQELLVTLTPITHDVTALAFSPDGRFFVSGSMDGVVRVWGVP